MCLYTYVCYRYIEVVSESYISSFQPLLPTVKGEECGKEELKRFLFSLYILLCENVFKVYKGVFLKLSNKYILQKIWIT